MIFPEDEKDYQQLFSFSVKSAKDGSVASELGGRRLTLSKELPESQNLKFQLVLKSTGTQDIQLQLQFDSPDSISNSRDGRDEIQMKINDLSKFVSSASGKSLSATLSGEAFSQELPPMLEDPMTGEKIGQAMLVMEILVYFVIGFTLVLCAFRITTIHWLWNFIRPLQLIFLSQIVDVPMPAHTYLFFSYPRLFKLDILQGTKLFNKLPFISSYEENSYSVKLVELGYKQLNFF